MSVLTDIKSSGTEDILITATDNLNSFTDTIRNVFPESKTQICAVHQIRNACPYVVWKVKKAFTADIKHIYNAPNQQAAKAALEDFAMQLKTNIPMPKGADGTIGKSLPCSLSPPWRSGK